MTTYKNPWHKDGKGSGPEFYETSAKPIEYRGHQLFHRIPGRCCDVVKDGSCVAQRVTVRGAKGWLDFIAA